MKMVFWALAAWFAVSAAAAVHVSPTNEKIQYTGRVNFSNPERVRFVYPPQPQPQPQAPQQPQAEQKPATEQPPVFTPPTDNK